MPASVKALSPAHHRVIAGLVEGSGASHAISVSQPRACAELILEDAAVRAAA